MLLAPLKAISIFKDGINDYIVHGTKALTRAEWYESSLSL